MTNRIFIKPAKGRAIFDPHTREKLPSEGAYRPRSTFYLRRLRDRDVVTAEPPKKASSKKKEG